MSEYAIIGWPLGHSLSPEIHNASFGALGLACRFDAIPLPPARLDSFMKSLPRSRLKGLAVTIPYKAEVLRYCESLESEVEAIGAANTVCVTAAGALRASNTDAAAAAAALRGAGADAAGKRVIVLGAGGAARAVCYQMLQEGVASLTVANRTLSRAQQLVADLRRVIPSAEALTAIPLENEAIRRSLAAADILINTTSVGMYPRVEESPLPHELLRAGLVVMDIVYNPLETRLLKATRETGGMAIPGTEMLLHQAVEQERIWLGVDAPLGVMREALLRGLARVP